eukprot:CAMPEP_0169074828 /NCGR_PEP_ID=MMETSP1015-20121227/7499_1 /TAXON_ID=342587 /ORGANISM="Karlodinium micrum, Strain CCMP2283" /LENGTH=259 /DNA_ID=CAMNT_0009134203 /DNA_START=33 /DNA_END=813 /DNA_ORIENTATION=-
MDAADKAKSMQASKIFVGGIPQNVDQSSFYKLFNEQVASVKKAWLQMAHVEPSQGQGLAKKHRGFGFVIFAEADAVDRLLGDAFSKMIYIDHMRFEVKRAVGKMGAAPKTPGLVTQRSPTNSPFGLKLDAAVPDRPSHANIFGSAPNFGPDSLISNSRQKQPSTADAIAASSAVLPNLISAPTFPAVGGSSQSHQMPWQNHATPFAVAAVQQISPQPHPTPTYSISEFVPDVFFDRYAGHNKHELEMVLRGAVPDCYDD